MYFLCHCPHAAEWGPVQGKATGSFCSPIPLGINSPHSDALGSDLDLRTKNRTVGATNARHEGSTLRYAIYQLPIFFQCLPRPLQVFKVAETGCVYVSALSECLHGHVLREGYAKALCTCQRLHESGRAPGISASCHHGHSSQAQREVPSVPSLRSPA